MHAPKILVLLMTLSWASCLSLRAQEASSEVAGFIEFTTTRGASSNIAPILLQPAVAGGLVKEASTTNGVSRLTIDWNGNMDYANFSA